MPETPFETPFFFPSGDARLFGMLHVPEQSGASKSAFLFSHPFGEEKLWSHRVFVDFARELAKAGHVVMRFDYRGAGDSSHVSADASLPYFLTDIAAAFDALLARHPAVERVGLMGLRLGATIAALFAEQAVGQDKYRRLHDAPLILWDPVTDGEAYLQELLRSNLSTQLAVYGKVLHDREVLRARILAGETVSVDGYDIGKALFESCGKNDLLAAAGKRHSGPTLVAQIVANETLKVRADLQNLAQGYPRAVFIRAIEQPFWREIKPFYGRAANLQQATLNWLNSLQAS